MKRQLKKNGLEKIVDYIYNRLIRKREKIERLKKPKQGTSENGLEKLSKSSYNGTVKR